MWISKTKIHDDLNIISYVHEKWARKKRWKHTMKIYSKSEPKIWRLHKIAAMQLPQFSIDERTEWTNNKKNHTYFSFDVSTLCRIFFFFTFQQICRPIYICKMTRLFCVFCSIVLNGSGARGQKISQIQYKSHSTIYMGTYKIYIVSKPHAL